MKEKALGMKETGNEMFREGNHLEACKLYSKALRSCPKQFKEERSMLYNNRGAAKTKLVFLLYLFYHSLVYL